MAAIAAERAGRRVLLMGNEAIARGAIEAGISLMAAYPGTPSSEIGEVLAKSAAETGMYVEWSTNEKVAFEVATGAALVGARAMVAMKNAGLNVAMDTFMTLSYTGVPSALIVVVADDPGAHYSSNEQDTRFAAAYAEIPCFEPANQQEAKDMVPEAVRLSEAIELPVFLRSVSRLSHASGDVRLGEPVAPVRKLGFNKHYELTYRWNVYGPPGAVDKHRWLHGALDKARAYVEETPWNRLTLTPGAKLGVITSGLGAAYVTEALDNLGVAHHMLRLGLAFPIPEKKVQKLLEASDVVLVVEEGDPVIEDQVSTIAARLSKAPAIKGKRNGGVLPLWGELNPDLADGAVRKVAALSAAEPTRSAKAVKAATSLVAARSSALCPGCSHLGSYWAVREVLRHIPGTHIVNGDIGCYEQAGYGVSSRPVQPTDARSQKYRIESPYEILDTLYVMGSGIGMAQGQAQAGYRDGKVLAVAGDSTFFHATLPAVANAAYSKAPITFLVFANCWTSMTGHQPNPTTGKSATAAEAPTIDIANACKALGISKVIEASAYDVKAAEAAIKEGVEFDGPSVVILKSECRLQFWRRQKNRKTTTAVNEDLCNGCRLCLQFGCPAITYDAARKKAGVDPDACTDCGLCSQICARHAFHGEVR
ncbi:MAG TPA: thiamine pyrophosphate-dependent enzyme [Bacillota bacterium]|jgi:indolepyruvate ferredoxin oxidoreductase alpha subunit